ncbi:hypothetical protein C0J50_18251 [Silurus asotus]|uniref:Peptidase C19 ubiquitin carboxyl-terminal hydrolase domain-containing protein n=1 Tax=Silurus asotus TaxID=30991 RepID=A0AAD5ASW8_SILAS|nr:hypothetical protein C0J50_18251 [Silurus asotus]
MMFSMFSSPRLWWKKNKFEYIPPSKPLPSTGSDPNTPKEPPETLEKFTGKGKDEAKKVFKWDFRRKNLVYSPADSNKNKENSVVASLGVAQEKLYEETNEFSKSVEDGNACRSKTMVSDRKINSTTLTVYPITKGHLLTAGFFVMLWKIRNNLEGEEVCSKVDCLLGLFNAVSDANPIFKLRKGNVRLKGRSFDTIAEIQLESQKVLKTIRKEDFQDTFQKWFLILQLQRFILSKNRKLIKLDHPVIIKSQLNINVSAFSKNGHIKRKCISQSSPKTPKPQKGGQNSTSFTAPEVHRMISFGTLTYEGHFVTDCISPNPPQWVNYNDEDVTLTTEEEVLKERSTCASVFLYEKVSTDETILLNE